MATYPIKVLLDRNRQPFIPFATTSSIVENGTNRRLDKILGNLDDLQTNNKNSLVSAINEILTQHGSGGSNTGWQVVNVLPTENISATTIYLLPKEGATKPNIYEEWIWVNEDWESIGTTEIDLTGYATTTMIGDLNTLQTTDKDSVVDAINEIVGTAGGTIANIGSLDNLTTEDKSSIVNAINEVLTNSVNSVTIKGNDMSITQNKLNISANIKKAIANAINKNFDKPLLINIQDPTNKTSLQFVVTVSKPTNSTSSQSMEYGLVNRSGILYSWKTRMIINKNGTTGLVTSVSFADEPLVQLSTVAYVNNITGDLTTLNTEDKSSLVSAINELFTSIGTGGGGSGSAFDPAKYLAIDNTTEYTPTDLYHPATKAYVDSQIASIPEPVDAYNKTEIDGMLSNYLSKTNTESYTPTSDYHPATKKFVESVVSSIDTSGYITESNISNHLANYITETTLNERLMKVPYIMTPRIMISSNFNSSDYWGDNPLICSISSTTDWSAAMQKIAQAVLAKNYPKVYLPITVIPNADNFNKDKAMYRRQFLIEVKTSGAGYFAEQISHTYTEGDKIFSFFDGIVDMNIYGTLDVGFAIMYTYSNGAWSYDNDATNPYADLYIGRATPVTNLNLTFDNKQIIHSWTEGRIHKRVFSSKVTGCKNLPVNATTKIADLAGTSTLPDGLSTKCELLGTTVSNDITTYTPLGEATVFVYNKEMYMRVPDITTTDYTDVVCTISMTYEA